MEADIEENEPPDGFRYSIVIKKFNSFCKNDLIKNEIKSVVRNCSKLALDAYNLLNLDVLRRIEDQKELPNYNSTYVYNCLTIVCKDTPTADPYLNQTYKDHFKPCIPDNYTRPYHKNCSLTRSEIARQMLVAIKNHTILNFQYRIRRFISVRYEIPFKVTKDFIYGTYSPVNIDQLQIEADKIENTKTKAQKLKRIERLKQWKPFQEELLDLFPKAPYPDVVKYNFSEFVKYSHRILAFMESLPSDKRGTRKFSIFPTKQDFVDSHILLTNSTFQETLQQIFSKTKTNKCPRCGYEAKNTSQLNSHFSRKTPCSPLVKDIEFSNLKHDCAHESISKKVFDNNKDEIWRRFFNLKGLEKEKRKFDYKISTNGYKVSIYFKVPKHAPADASENSLKYYDRIVGIDPGENALFTASVDDGSFISASRKSYRHDSCMNQQRYWYNNLKKRKPEYATIVSDMVSLKTSNIETFKEGLSHIYSVADDLFEFHSKNSIHKWRLKTKIMSEKTLSKFARRITNKKNTFIGIGDWSQSDTGVLKGHEPVPVKRLKEKLKQFFERT